MEDFPALCEKLWHQVMPLYKNLHAYVRRKLKEKYAKHAERFPVEGHVPAHLLGTLIVLVFIITKSCFSIFIIINNTCKAGFSFVSPSLVVYSHD